MSSVCSIDLQSSGVILQCALNSGMVTNVTSVRSGTRVINVVSLDLECQAHDASLTMRFSSAAVEAGVSIPPKVNP